MEQAVIKEKILDLQGELELLRQAVLKEPDFNLDERNWQKLGSAAKKIRKGLFRKSYGGK